MSLLNVFKSKLFKTTTLTAAINATETPPQRIAQLGLFEEQGVPTTSVVIERKDSRLEIAPALPRGADPTPMKDPTRKGIALVVPHVPVRDRLMADELQDVRAFGSEDQMVGVETARDEKLQTMDDTLTVTEIWSLAASYVREDRVAPLLERASCAQSPGVAMFVMRMLFPDNEYASPAQSIVTMPVMPKSRRASDWKLTEPFTDCPKIFLEPV